ncbi:ribosome biogenesis GTPase YqeH [Anaerorhabdus sp.]|uniref:ribosome biogenesis GTPase YqeH n=1 Tax=Anaerorhabdus sp. TaxID=1872524 RepID=UPI002FC9B92D
MTICKGCGIQLQTTDPKGLGYTPKENSDYCQRCFRLMHYDDLMISMKTGINPDVVLERINKTDGLILWVVDLFDFEASMIDGLNRHLMNRDIVMVATKRDLLPETLGNEKIANFIFHRLKELNIQIQGLVVTGKNIKEGVEEVYHALDQLGHGRDVIVMGKANAGKSTLLNALLNENRLTSSRYPGTTLDFNRIEANGYTFIDTPGIEGEKTMLMAIDEKDLKTILPTRRLKPLVFQCKDDQSFAIGGLVRVDFMGCRQASVVFYTFDECPIHRGKVEGADERWINLYGNIYQPTPIEKDFTKTKTQKTYDKMDIVIDGLGWVSVSGNVSEIVVSYPRNVHVTFRKAML